MTACFQFRGSGSGGHQSLCGRLHLVYRMQRGSSRSAGELRCVQRLRGLRL